MNRRRSGIQGRLLPFGAFLLSALFLCLPIDAMQDAASVSSPAGLLPGDQIIVHMYDFPDAASTVQVRVSGDGTVTLPYAGTLQAAGKSTDEVRREISDSLKSRGIVKDPNVTVDVVSAVNFTVNVLGQVASPKSLPLYSPTPISTVIGLAGGLSQSAAHHLTILHHSDQTPTSIDYDPDAPTAAALSTLVYPGDIVSVSSRGVFFIAGEVNKPGIYPIGGVISAGGGGIVGQVEHITLLEALAQAGGITSIAARSRLHILGTIDGKREDIRVDQVKLSKGEVADPLLHPNDIIYLPPSYWRQQTNNLFSTALSGLYAATAVKEYGFY